MKALWTMPSIDRAFGDACAAGMRVELLRVDNWAPNQNRGVAASWNLGVDRVLADRLDYLVLVSESVRFGPAGGRDFEGMLDGLMCSGGPCDGTCPTVDDDTGAGYCRAGFGWHLIGLSREALERVGRFDEVFWPAWWEDNDWTRRLSLLGDLRPGDVVCVGGIQAHLVAVEHSLSAGFVASHWSETAAAYAAKWGGMPGSETFTTPYGR